MKSTYQPSVMLLAASESKDMHFLLQNPGMSTKSYNCSSYTGMLLNILNEKYETPVVNEIFDTVQYTMILEVVKTPVLGTE
jgi:hypothetical protein